MNINKAYLEKIKAPRKENFQVSNVDQGFNQSIVDNQYQVIKSLSIQNKHFNF